MWLSEAFLRNASFGRKKKPNDSIAFLGMRPQMRNDVASLRDADDFLRIAGIPARQYSYRKMHPRRDAEDFHKCPILPRSM